MNRIKQQSFKLLSPTGNWHYVTGETIYEAIQRAVELDNYVFSNCDYFEINDIKIEAALNPHFKCTKTNIHLN